MPMDMFYFSGGPGHSSSQQQLKNLFHANLPAGRDANGVKPQSFLGVYFHFAPLRENLLSLSSIDLRSNKGICFCHRNQRKFYLIRFQKDSHKIIQSFLGSCSFEPNNFQDLANNLNRMPYSKLS